MSIKVKYQYTHFIYPFVIDNKQYIDFIKYILSQQKDWKLKINEYKNDTYLYNFYLPYMRKFLFPILFWQSDFKKEFKTLSLNKKASILSKLSCVTFEYKLSNIKLGKLENEYGLNINYDISKIDLICFEPGICFLDIKAQIEDENEMIDISKVQDFNHYFRKLTPRIESNYELMTQKLKNSKSANRIIALIDSITSKFEKNNFDRIYYDKMFTYTYVCVDGWKNVQDFDKMKNDFLKLQYVAGSHSTEIFNCECSKIKDNMYSRWEYSTFGFSRESGIVFVSDKEKYNITRMPYNFEKTYLYMLLLAFYQRISLINFSQDLLEEDKTKARALKKRFTKFTNMSWFSQITNSEHGMDIWEKWQNAFGLRELFDEVRKEYIEYYDFAMASGQERINVLLLLLYTISIVFTGLQVLVGYFDISGLENYIIAIMLIAIFSYPLYVLIWWITHKLKIK